LRTKSDITGDLKLCSAALRLNIFKRENKKGKKKRESLSSRRAASLVKVFEGKYYPAGGGTGDFASKPAGPDLEKSGTKAVANRIYSPTNFAVLL
tara:strand:- start:41888 stop:42172 length:285 start_codon:yes stop_codon:yes gene_type:complete